VPIRRTEYGENRVPGTGLWSADSPRCRSVGPRNRVGEDRPRVPIRPCRPRNRVGQDRPRVPIRESGPGDGALECRFAPLPIGWSKESGRPGPSPSADSAMSPKESGRPGPSPSADSPHRVRRESGLGDGALECRFAPLPIGWSKESGRPGPSPSADSPHRVRRESGLGDGALECRFAPLLERPRRRSGSAAAASKCHVDDGRGCVRDVMRLLARALAARGLARRCLAHARLP
jgi:hypothetical protein